MHQILPSDSSTTTQVSRCFKYTLFTSLREAPISCIRKNRSIETEVNNDDPFATAKLVAEPANPIINVISYI